MFIDSFDFLIMFNLLATCFHILLLPMPECQIVCTELYEIMKIIIIL